MPHINTLIFYLITQCSLNILYLSPTNFSMSGEHLKDSLALIFMMSPAHSPTGHITTVNQNW